MAETRPGGSLALPGVELPLLQEIATVGPRGRLHLLPRWTGRVGFDQDNRSDELNLLIVLDEPGRLTLRSWKTDGSRVVARAKELLNDSEGNFDALLHMRDTYGHLVVPKDRRVHLGDVVLQHLGLPTDRSERSNVYVEVHSNQIEVISPAYRNKRHLDRHALLDDLP